MKCVETADQQSETRESFILLYSFLFKVKVSDLKVSIAVLLHSGAIDLLDQFDDTYLCLYFVAVHEPDIAVDGKYPAKNFPTNRN